VGRVVIVCSKRLRSFSDHVCFAFEIPFGKRLAFSRAFEELSDRIVCNYVDRRTFGVHWSMVAYARRFAILSEIDEW